MIRGTAGDAIANKTWAKDISKCGFRVKVRLDVAADASSVLILLTNESDEVIRLNLTKSAAHRLRMELDAAVGQKQWDPAGFLRS